MEKGVLYACTGAKLLEEAISSAQSVRKYNETIEIAIYTDLVDLAKESGTFGQVYEIKNPAYSYQDKISPLYKSPFQETLFLDSDTRVLADIYELFTLLQRFDLAVAHAPIRYSADNNRIPGIFPEFNTGVLLFKQKDEVESFLKEWERKLLMQVNKGKFNFPDQPAFRECLWKNKELNFYVLTPEYNLRTLMPYFVGGGAKAVILHDREPRISFVEKRINKTLKPRTGGRSLWLKVMFIIEKVFYNN